jgi:hypothetical protein
VRIATRDSQIANKVQVQDWLRFISDMTAYLQIFIYSLKNYYYIVQEKHKLIAATLWPSTRAHQATAAKLTSAQLSQ